MSSFLNQDVFGSGPHRFSVGRRGYVVTPNAFEPGGGPGSGIRDVRELDVWVSGRLVASSEAGLWSLREAIAGLCEVVPATPGKLIDSTGRSFDDMTLVRYVESEQRDRGRVWSIGYVAQFRRFAV